MSEWEPTTRPVIVCAANKLSDGNFLLGIRHGDGNMRCQFKALYGKNALKVGWLHKMVRFYQGRPPTPRSSYMADEGFIDQFGRYYTREEAMLIARANDQIIVPEHQMLSITALHSEDLY